VAGQCFLLLTKVVEVGHHLLDVAADVVELSSEDLGVDRLRR
jgi:hypothetical protein